jgi:ubiquinone/menaquinone biosynthesis C-methylase UbiE
MTDSKIKIVHEQFDKVPYPNTAIGASFQDDINFLFKYCITTPNYRRSQKIVTSAGKLILDAACGTGFLTLALAQANPSSKVIGIDISEESIKWARRRLDYHGYQNVEFYVMPLEELPRLGLFFDFIHCNDTLSLLPDPVEGLRAMRAVLAPQGVIHGNLHSIYQRHYYYQAQKLCKFLGLMDDAPGEMEFSILREIMNSIDDQVMLKNLIWKSNFDDTALSVNYLLQEDKGYTIREMFQIIEDSDLEFISMVNWNQWDPRDLYKDKNNPSEYLDMLLGFASSEEKLQIYELLHPVNRLLDFWCGHLGEINVVKSPEQWSNETWQNAKAYLHPKLKHPKIKAALEQALSLYAPFDIHEHLNINASQQISLYTTSCACLHLLWDTPLTVMELAQKWLRIKPVNWFTEESITEELALSEVKHTLVEMESLMLVLLEI